MAVVLAKMPWNSEGKPKLARKRSPDADCCA
jgi:hypothetical protein